MGLMIITVLGMVADMELKFIRDQQRAGHDGLHWRITTKKVEASCPTREIHYSPNH